MSRGHLTTSSVSRHPSSSMDSHCDPTVIDLIPTKPSEPPSISGVRNGSPYEVRSMHRVTGIGASPSVTVSTASYMNPVHPPERNGGGSRGDIGNGEPIVTSDVRPIGAITISRTVARYGGDSSSPGDRGVGDVGTPPPRLVTVAEHPTITV